MLARRYFDWADFACQHGVCMHVVRMCGFFDPRRPVHGEGARHPYRNWKIPALVGVEHESAGLADGFPKRSEEHTSELQSLRHLVCRLLLEKKKNNLAQFFIIYCPRGTAVI